MQGPDPALAVAQYRARAPGYDRLTRRMEPARREAIARLGLRPGDTVLDVACGTGRSLPLLAERIGPRGRIIGVDLSPEMLAIARERLAAAGLVNATLIPAPMERARIPGPVDAILFCYTHDVLQSPPALANIFAAARPGARVACTGMKGFPWWLAPLNLLVLAKARGYVTTLAGLGAPWRNLQLHVPGLRVESLYGGLAYVAAGRLGA